MALSALLVMGAFMVGRVVGVLDDVIKAQLFGTSGVLSAYSAAFRLPELLNNLFSRDDNLPISVGIHGDGPLADWHGRLEAQAGDIGRLAMVLAILKDDKYRIALDGDFSAARFLPPAIAPLIGDDATFRLAARAGAHGDVTVDNV